MARPDPTALEDGIFKLFEPDYYSGIVSTGNAKATSEWMQKHLLGRAPIGKDPTKWLYIGPTWKGCLIKIKGEAVTVPLLSHLALKVSVPFRMADASAALEAERFMFLEGDVDVDGFGYKIYVSPPELGNFPLHVACRLENCFVDPYVKP